MKVRLLGRLGTWLCDRYSPRPATRAETAEVRQYAGLMVDVLLGQVPYYGRDREADTEATVAVPRKKDGSNVFR